MFFSLFLSSQGLHFKSVAQKCILSQSLCVCVPQVPSSSFLKKIVTAWLPKDHQVWVVWLFVCFFLKPSLGIVAQKVWVPQCRWGLFPFCAAWCLPVTHEALLSFLLHLMPEFICWLLQGPQCQAACRPAPLLGGAHSQCWSSWCCFCLQEANVFCGFSSLPGIINNLICMHPYIAIPEVCATFCLASPGKQQNAHQNKTAEGAGKVVPVVSESRLQASACWCATGMLVWCQLEGAGENPLRTHSHGVF